MTKLPDDISTEAQLDEILSHPSEALVECLAGLEGDIMILGAGGKIGPSMTRMAHRAVKARGAGKRVLAVDVMPLDALKAEGIETMRCDLLDLEAVRKLPRCRNVVYMVGRKFGSTGKESLTWAINVIVPYHVAATFTESRVAVFSTGCVYPVVDIKTGGSVERDPADPVGEYAMSCLGRERMFDHFADTRGEKVVQIRLNYAVELRYGVLFDIATRVQAGEPVDVTTGFVNVMWQGDVCDQVLRSLPLAASPARILNVTGPEVLSVRRLAQRFGELLGKEPKIAGQENGRGYLNNATQANHVFGNPSVPAGRVVEWVAKWVQRGGPALGKPTHFETQDGKY